MTRPERRYEWPIEDTLFDNPTGDYPPEDTTRSMYVKGRHRAIQRCQPIDDYQPDPEGQP